MADGIIVQKHELKSFHPLTTPNWRLFLNRKGSILQMVNQAHTSLLFQANSIFASLVVRGSLLEQF